MTDPATPSALELLLFFRCPDCGAPAGEYLGDDKRHVFGVDHDAGCPHAGESS